MAAAVCYIAISAKTLCQLNLISGYGHSRLFMREAGLMQGFSGSFQHGTVPSLVQMSVAKVLRQSTYQYTCCLKLWWQLHAMKSSQVIRWSVMWRWQYYLTFPKLPSSSGIDLSDVAICYMYTHRVCQWNFVPSDGIPCVHE